MLAILTQLGAAMACDNSVLPVHDNWIQKTELTNTRRNLCDLLVTMRSAVSRVWYQVGHFSLFILRISHAHALQSSSADHSTKAALGDL